MTRGCHKYEMLIDKRASGLTVGEQLSLEEHVGSCPTCLRTLRAVELVHETLQRASSGLSESARQRALTRALDRAEAKQIAVLPNRPSKLPMLAAAAALLALGGGLYAYGARDAQPRLAAAPVAPDTPLAPAGEGALAEGGAPRTEQPGWIVASQPEQRTMGHARVALAAGTRARFDAASSTLALAEGEVQVDVDARLGKPFVVVTEHLRVEVLGTQFRVSAERVSVTRGKVRVLDGEGKVLAAELGAGQEYVRSQPGALATRAEAAPKVSARGLLVKAREALAHSQPGEARALIEQAERAKPTRRERAEALTLRAECAMVERDGAAAARLYEQVAKQFPELSAGENAAFAAAQLALRGQDKVRARQLLQAYLARYPKGRFAEEAGARLSTLPP